MSLPRRPLGRTGLSVSVLAQGGAAFGEQYGPAPAAQVAAVVERAIGAGVNLFDTAAYYGRGRSERVLGDALADLGPGVRDQVLICTKAGRDDVAAFDFSPEHIRESLDASLRRLRTDRVDILIAHDIEFAPDLEAVYDATVRELHALKAAGKCRLVGVSGYPLHVLRRAVEQCELDVVMTYAHYTLQNTRLLTDLLPACAARGVGVLNASPLALGLLTDAGPQPWHPAPEPLKAAAREAASLCRERGTTVADLGMRFCLAAEGIASTVTGTARVDELEHNLSLVGQAPDPALVAEVRAIFERAGGVDVAWESGRASSESRSV